MDTSRLSWIPNGISVLRLLLTVPFIWGILEHRFDWVFWMLVGAAISDIADGAIARALNAPSELGAILDPMADKVLLSFGFVALAWVGAVPAYLALVSFGRDLVIALGALAYRRRHGDFRVLPTLAGKASTFGLFFYGCAAIAAQLWEWPQQQMSLDVFGWICLLLLVGSGLHYIHLGRSGKFEVRGAPQSQSAEKA
ncbi:MAG: CDP-alcohol phosphatidyltransferase family protein [Gammaproteobacteria bacterium AqS3]|nr:CDP-alcohol phosphatidyltransferase family protein [Gammaproteobacteria bacterium AqS3]